ncbi:MAG: hypothetical protein JW841_07620 [Deltaproteobacteria bacterium]|nr:hypothetical protein [Deltaproteobacteria bacterium]
MKDYDALLKMYKLRLQKALQHLRYSFSKISNANTKVQNLSEAELESWESFAARHARVVDLFLAKYVRAFVLKDDPGFNGSLRDFANQAEKLGLIDSAHEWMALRELRNIIAHEYTDEDTEVMFNTLKDTAPRLLLLEKKI